MSLTPRTLLHARYVFKSKHARQVKSVVGLCGMGAVAPLLDGVVANLKSAELDPADERIHQCAVAEVFAGIARAVTSDRFDDAARAEVWALLVPAAEQCIGAVSFEYSADWADALRFLSAKRDPSLLEPFTAMIVAKVMQCFTGVVDGGGDGGGGEGGGGGGGGAGGGGGNGSGDGDPMVVEEAAAVVESKTAGARDDYSTQAKWLRMLQVGAVLVLMRWGGSGQTLRRASAGAVGW